MTPPSNGMHIHRSSTDVADFSMPSLIVGDELKQGASFSCLFVITQLIWTMINAMSWRDVDIVWSPPLLTGSGAEEVKSSTASALSSMMAITMNLAVAGLLLLVTAVAIASDSLLSCDGDDRRNKFCRRSRAADWLHCHRLSLLWRWWRSCGETSL